MTSWPPSLSPPPSPHLPIPPSPSTIHFTSLQHTLVCALPLSEPLLHRCIVCTWMNNTKRVHFGVVVKWWNAIVRLVKIDFDAASLVIHSLVVLWLKWHPKCLTEPSPSLLSLCKRPETLICCAMKRLGQCSLAKAFWKYRPLTWILLVSHLLTRK